MQLFHSGKDLPKYSKQKDIIISKPYQTPTPMSPLVQSISSPLYKAKTPAMAAAAPTPIYFTTLSWLAAPVLFGPLAALTAELALLPATSLTMLCTCAFWLS